MILAPYCQIGLPFLYNAVEEGSLTAVKDRSIIGNAIRDLHSDGVQITSIVGDNEPAQLTSLAHWSATFQVRAQGGTLNKIWYQAWLCHVMRLSVEDNILESAQFHALDATLHEMVRISNLTVVHSMTSSRCLVPVAARSPSPESYLFWLLAHEPIIERTNLATLTPLERERFTEAMRRENFRRIEILHHLIHPFAKCIKLFERDLVTICFVYPVLEQLYSFVDAGVRCYLRESHKEYVECVADLVR
jgi:hypothetical protein